VIIIENLTSVLLSQIQITSQNIINSNVNTTTIFKV